MLGHGPEQSQQQLNRAIYDFFSGALNSGEAPAVEFQRAFLLEIEHIITLCVKPDELSFNEALNIDEKSYFPSHLVESLNLFIIKEKLNTLSKQYGVKFPQPEAPYQFPTRLIKNAEQLTDEDGKTYQFTGKLGGRGQKGLANFYSDGRHEILVKEDDPATCILEGTASFITHCDLLPKTVEKSVNYASVATMVKDDTKTIVVSVQDRVKSEQESGSVRPWDQIVYGMKRDPAAWVSWESRWQENIKQNIAGLSPNVKWQLAASLFACAVAGDESLHVGQFMALLDYNNNITGIKRIDLGARERYAVARNKNKQHSPYHDSIQYQSTGQWGKDYLSFLLADPSFRKIYTMLWLNLASKDESLLKKNIKDASKSAFLMQFQNIPEELHDKTLQAALEVVNKDAKQDKISLSGHTTEQRIESLADILAQIDANRVIDMLDVAKAEYVQGTQLEVNRFAVVEDKAILHNLFEASKFMQAILIPKKENIVDMGVAFELVDKFNNNINDLIEDCVGKSKNVGNLKQIELLSEVSIDLLQAVYLRLLNETQDTGQNKDEMKVLEDKINQLQTFADISHYCLQTQSEDKIPYAIQALNLARSGKEELAKYISNKSFIDHISAHTSNYGYAKSFVVANKAQGEMLLRKLFQRYQLDVAPIMLTIKARKLLDLIAGNNLEEVEKFTANSTFKAKHALIPDEQGMTALHYLMANENLNEQGMQAIVNILTKTIGRTYNSAIDIPNRDGNTPLDLLMQNKNAQAIIDKINGAHIKGYYGGVYKVQDFFNLKEHDPKWEERLLQMSKSAPVVESKKSTWW